MRYVISLVLMCLAFNGIVLSDEAFALDVPGIATSPDVPPAPTVENPPDLMAQYEAVKKAYEAIKSAQPGADKTLLVYGLLASLTWLLIAGLKRTSPFITDPSKKVLLPKIALILGVAAGLLSMLALGQPWLISAIYGAGPPTAVLIQELFFQKKS